MYELDLPHGRLFYGILSAQQLFQISSLPSLPGRVGSGDNLIPFVQTYNTHLLGPNRQLKENFVVLQDQVPGFKEYRLILAYRRNRNLQDILVHTRFSKSRDEPPFLTLAHLYNSVSGKGQPIYQTVGPDSNNVVYAIKCLTCGALYIGESRHSMRVRVKQHLYYIRRQKDRLLYNHFQMHPVEQLRVIGLQSDLR